MKVQYVAYDGKIFDSEAKCKDYETEKILMGSFSGRKTSDFEEAACFVYVPDNETLNFFLENYGNNPDAENITMPGFYIWDSVDEDGYIRIDLDIFNALKFFLRKYCN